MLLLDGEGKERARLEGYLPNNDFNAALRNGLGRIALFTRNTPMRNDGTAMSSLAMGIRILHRRRCTGGLWRATRPRTITPYWAKSPRNFEPYIRQPVDEQVHSVVALIRIDPLAKIDSQELPI